MRQRADLRYNLKRGIALLLIAAFTLGFTACSDEQPELFPRVVQSKNEPEPTDQESHVGRSLSWPDLQEQEIVLTVAAPMSQESLNRIRLLYLYKLDMVKSENSENEESSATKGLDQESLIHQLDYDLDRLDEFLADYDRGNFRLELVPVSLDSGATRQQQELWLSQTNHPNIFYSADANMYFRQNRLADLETLVSQDVRFHAGTVYSNVLKPFYQEENLYGLPFLMTYPIIIGSAQVWNSESTLPFDRWDVWLDHLSLSIENEKREDNDPSSEAPIDDTVQPERPTPFSLEQPWLTYMQLAFMDQTAIDRQIGEANTPVMMLPSQELIESWNRLWTSGFVTETDVDLPEEPQPVLPDYTSDSGLLTYQANRSSIQPLAEAGDIMAWLDDSSQLSYWQSQNQDWQAVGVPALQMTAPYNPGVLLAVRGWFVDNQSDDAQTQAFAQALSVFLSIDPDCYLILALESVDPLTGYLPAIKDDRVWQRYLSDTNQMNFTSRKWQEVVPQSIVSDDLLREGWSELLNLSLQDELAAWNEPEESINRAE